MYNIDGYHQYRKRLLNEANEVRTIVARVTFYMNCVNTQRFAYFAFANGLIQSALADIGPRVYLQVRSIRLKYQRVTNSTSKLPCLLYGVCLVCCSKYTIWEIIFRIIEFVRRLASRCIFIILLLCNKNNFGGGQCAFVLRNVQRNLFRNDVFARVNCAQIK